MPGAFVQIIPEQRKQSAVAFLEAAVDCCPSLGIKVRVVTDHDRAAQSEPFGQTQVSVCPDIHQAVHPMKNLSAS